MELPSYCGDCGVPLLAGWTKHKPGCSIQTIIDDFRKSVSGRKKRKREKVTSNRIKVLKPKSE